MPLSLRTAAVLLVFAAGCGSSRVATSGSSSTASSTSAAVSSPTSTAPAASPTPSSAPASTAAATTAATPSTAPATTAARTSSPVAPDFPSLSACIARKWILVADQADNVFDGSAMQRLPGFSQVTTGEGPLEFRADGTYTYTPNFSIQLTLNGVTGTGAWSGTLKGTWSATDTTLSMTPTDNGITGSIEIFGVSQPLPPFRTFNGQARVVRCQPDTLSYELPAPSGTFATTLVGA